MRKTILATVFVGLLASSHGVMAMDHDHPPGAEVVDVLLLRPAGLFATLIGGVSYLALSPLTAIAMISPPHDAFERLALPLVLKPFAFTFDRPLGSFKTNSE